MIDVDWLIACPFRLRHKKYHHSYYRSAASLAIIGGKKMTGGIQTLVNSPNFLSNESSAHPCLVSKRKDTTSALQWDHNDRSTVFLRIEAQASINLEAMLTLAFIRGRREIGGGVYWFKRQIIPHSSTTLPPVRVAAACLLIAAGLKQCTQTLHHWLDGFIIERKHKCVLDISII